MPDNVKRCANKADSSGENNGGPGRFSGPRPFRPQRVWRVQTRGNLTSLVSLPTRCAQHGRGPGSELRPFRPQREGMFGPAAPGTDTVRLVATAPGREFRGSNPFVLKEAGRGKSRRSRTSHAKI